MNGRKEPQWGLVSAIPDNSPAGYGARCIQSHGAIGFVADRTGTFSYDNGHKIALEAILNRAGFMDHIRHRYAELFEQGKFQQNSRDVETLFEDRAIIVKASTNGSFGYVYLAAWLRPSDDVRNLIDRDHPDYEKWDDGLVTRWTKGHLPAIGDKIQIRINNIGSAIVLRHARMCGWLNLIAIPTDPPEWYRKQNGIGSTWSVCSVVGGEIN